MFLMPPLQEQYELRVIHKHTVIKRAHFVRMNCCQWKKHKSGIFFLGTRHVKTLKGCFHLEAQL